MPACISVNTTEIIMRNSVRNELKNKMAEFLKSNSITVLEARTAPRSDRPAYNSALSVSPARAKQVSLAREELAALVRELSIIEIESINCIDPDHLKQLQYIIMIIHLKHLQIRVPGGRLHAVSRKKPVPFSQDRHLFLLSVVCKTSL